MPTPQAPPAADLPVPITARALYDRLYQTLEPYALEVLDETWQHQGHAGARGLSEGTHFRVRIGAKAFAGKRAVAAHRLVYQQLQDYLEQGLHALAIEILPPEPE